MKGLSLGLLSLLLAACIVAAPPGKTAGGEGYLQTGKSVYDGKRYAKLFPGSLFDADDRPGVFRLGLAWDERYDQNLHLIVSFPLQGSMSIEDIKRSAGSLKVKIDGKEIKLSRATNSVVLKEENIIITREFNAEIRYAGSKELIESMLAARNVVLQLNAINRMYEGSLRSTGKGRGYYTDVGYMAINGIQRFHKAVWGDNK